MGTSLTVHPFASLTRMVPVKCPRVLINLEQAGDIGERPDDVLCLGKCDDVVQELAQELGWANELKKAWDKTKYSVEGVEAGSDAEEDLEEPEEVEETEEERLMREVAQLTKSVDQTLKVTDALRRNVENDVQVKASPRSTDPPTDEGDGKPAEVAS